MGYVVKVDRATAAGEESAAREPASSRLRRFWSSLSTAIRIAILIGVIGIAATIAVMFGLPRAPAPAWHSPDAAVREVMDDASEGNSRAKRGNQGEVTDEASEGSRRSQGAVSPGMY